MKSLTQFVNESLSIKNFRPRSEYDNFIGGFQFTQTRMDLSARSASALLYRPSKASQKFPTLAKFGEHLYGELQQAFQAKFGTEFPEDFIKSMVTKKKLEDLSDYQFASANGLMDAVLIYLGAKPAEFGGGNFREDWSGDTTYMSYAYGRHLHTWSKGLPVLEDAKNNPVKVLTSYILFIDMMDDLRDVPNMPDDSTAKEMMIPKIVSNVKVSRDSKGVVAFVITTNAKHQATWEAIKEKDDDFNTQLTIIVK